MSKKRIIFGTILIVLSLGLVQIGMGQTNKRLDEKKQLTGRLVRAVNVKEPRFSGGQNVRFDERENSLNSFIGWKFWEAYVNVSISDYYLEKDAKDFMRINVSEAKLSHFRNVAIRLTNLGDEAWLAITDNFNRKNGRTQIVLRKGSIIMTVSATSPNLAKRFARYFVTEIEKRDRGEP